MRPNRYTIDPVEYSNDRRDRASRAQREARRAERKALQREENRKAGLFSSPEEMGRYLSQPKTPAGPAGIGVRAGIGVNPGKEHTAGGKKGRIGPRSSVFGENLEARPGVTDISYSKNGKSHKGGWWTKERQQHAYSVLTEKAKLSDLGAKGLISRWANVEAKAGPTAKNPKGAFGIAQWTGDRKKALGGTTDFDAQLNHVVSELNGKEKKAGDLLRDAQTMEQGAIGASAYERAEGYNARTKRDNFTRATMAGMSRISVPDTQVAQAAPTAPTGGLASFFSDPLGMKAQAAEAPAGLAAYAPDMETGAAPARIDAMFSRAQTAPALSSKSVFDGFQRPAVDTPHNFPGMSVPADVASPHTMANLGGLAGYLSQQQPPSQARISPTDLGTPAPQQSQNVASFTPSGPMTNDVYTPSTSVDPSAGYADPMQVAAAKEWGAKQAATVDPNTPETYAQQGEDRAGWQAEKAARNAAAQVAAAQSAPEMAYAPEAKSPAGLQAAAPAAPSAPQGLAAPASPQGLGGITQAMNAVKNAASFAPPGGTLADLNRFAPNAAPALNAPTDVKDYNVAAAPTVADPNAPDESLNTFPDAPPAPTRMDAFKASIGPAAKRGLMGYMLGGPVGGLLGVASGLMGGMGGLGDPSLGPASAGEQYGIGSGLGAMQSAMSNQRGATAYSRSNPNTSRTSRGWGLGSDLTNQYGMTTPYSADGSIAGGNRQSLSAWGDVLGGLFGGESKKDKDKSKGSGRGLGGISPGASGAIGRGLGGLY